MIRLLLSSPVLIVFIAILAVLSLHLGHRLYAPSTVIAALFNPDGSADSIIIASLRVPRTITAISVGAALAVSGLLMQGVLRNQLAEPGLLGVNAGAAFAVVLGLGVFGITSFLNLTLLSILGALATMGLVFGVASAAGKNLSPISLMLAGVTIAALAASMTQIIIILDEATMQALLFWLAGGYADRDVSLLRVIAPILWLMTMFSYLTANLLDAMNTDRDTAHGLGVDVPLMQFALLTFASVLAALCVALAGPVAFIGLIAPHIARLSGRIAHRVLIPRVALIGAALSLTADIVARFVVAPQEMPVGAVLALMGAPIFLMLLRQDRVRLA